MMVGFLLVTVTSLKSMTKEKSISFLKSLGHRRECKVDLDQDTMVSMKNNYKVNFTQIIYFLIELSYDLVALFCSEI